MSINPGSHIPIYRQIADRIRRQIAAGVYRVGEGLPSPRALAMELVVNPNTVQRAYEYLEREGVVVSRKGVGLFVAKKGVASAKQASRREAAALLSHAIRAARAADLSNAEIRAMFGKAMLAAKSSRSET